MDLVLHQLCYFLKSPWCALGPPSDMAASVSKHFLPLGQLSFRSLNIVFHEVESLKAVWLRLDCFVLLSRKSSRFSFVIS